MWWWWLARVFSHADCVCHNASPAGKDPSGFGTVSVSNCCYLLIGFQHVASSFIRWQSGFAAWAPALNALSEDTELSVFKITSRAKLNWRNPAIRCCTSWCKCVFLIDSLILQAIQGSTLQFFTGNNWCALRVGEVWLLSRFSSLRPHSREIRS